MAVQIQIRRGTAAAWTSANPILGDGELAVESDTRKFKIGDGATTWNSLAYSSVTLASPGPIGSSTPSTGAFTTISASGLVSANAGITTTNVTASGTVTATGAITGSNLSGTNTGDNAANTTYANDYRAANFVAGTNYVAPTGSDGIVTRQMLKDCGFTFYDSTTTNALDYTNGSMQRWAPNTGAQTLSITNWPPTGNLGELLIQGINLGAATITWPTINWLKSDGTFTTTFSSNGVTLQSSGTDFVFLWTRDAGTTIYGKVMR